MLLEYLKLNGPSANQGNFLDAEQSPRDHGGDPARSARGGSALDTECSPRVGQAGARVLERIAQAQNYKIVVNLRQFSRIIDALARAYYGRVAEAHGHLLDKGQDASNQEQDREIRAIQKRSLAKNAKTSLECLLESLQQKLRVNFAGPGEAYRFFDVNANQRCTKAHFVFNCAFLEVDHDLAEVLELFEILDARNDGVLDEGEFSAIFEGMQDSWNSHHHNILNSVLRDSKKAQLMLSNEGPMNIDIGYAHNTTEKLAPTRQDTHQYPHFSGAGQMLTRGQPRDVASVCSTQAAKKRTLSILDKQGRLMSTGATRNTAAGLAGTGRPVPPRLAAGVATNAALMSTLSGSGDACGSSRLGGTHTGARKPSAGAKRKGKAASQAKVAQVWTQESLTSAAKNQSQASQYRQLQHATATALMKRLMENQYTAEHVEERLERDRRDFLDARLLKGRPRLFRNYVETNTN